MSEETAIAWTDKTWNPWQGCKKVSPACKNCYMFRDKGRLNHDPSVVHLSKDRTFNRPLYWTKSCRVFVCSWSDFFIEEADIWRDKAWEIMESQAHLTFQILTKRPENIPGRLPANWPLPNVWLGVTAENSDMFHQRVNNLIDIPAVVKFISMEPLLEDIASLNLLTDVDAKKHIDWVIVGGESGLTYRPFDPDWARKIRDECKISDIAFYMKQMSGNDLEARANIPSDLMIREFPR